MGCGFIKGYLHIILAAFLWSTIPIFSKLLYADGVDAYSVAAMRALIPAVFFIIKRVCEKRAGRTERRRLPFYLLFGAVTISGLYVSYLVAISGTSVASASMLLYTAPCFVILFSRLFFRTRITRINLITLAMTFLGCAMTVGLFSEDALSAASPVGLAAGLASGICYSFLTIFSQYAGGYDARDNLELPLIFGALILIFVKPFWTIGFSPYRLALFACIGVIGALLPMYFYQKGLRLGVSGIDAGLIANLEPCLAIAASFFIFSDRLAALQSAGIFVVLAGVSLPIAAARRRLR